MSLYAETTGYLIHQRSYKDSSLILEFFSQDLGKLQLIAKGIKKNKRFKSELQYFNLLKIQYFGKSQLKTLSSINILTQYSKDRLLEKTAGLYLNELIHYSLAEKSNNLFQCYTAVLSKLGQEKLTPLLRTFEKELLKYCGFELSVELFNGLDSWLSVDQRNGLIEVYKESNKICTVDELTRFLNNQTLDNITQKKINTLMKKMIDLSVNYRRIYARELLVLLTSA